jgi:hypothetical protein
MARCDGVSTRSRNRPDFASTDDRLRGDHAARRCHGPEPELETDPRPRGLVIRNSDIGGTAWYEASRDRCHQYLYRRPAGRNFRCSDRKQ